MPEIQLLTFGRLSLSHDGVPNPVIPQQKLRCALLVVLATEQQITRDALMGMLWPDRPTDRARRALSQMIYELRRALSDDVIVTTGDSVQAGPALMSDVRQFSTAFRVGDLDRVCSLYVGPFLADFVLGGAPEFETWADRHRALFARQHRKAQRERVQTLIAAGHVSRALDAARSWTDHEPLDDEAHHRLIELLNLNGLRSEALLQYDRYAERVKDALGVEPLDETIALVNEIRQTHPASVSSRGNEGHAAPANLNRLISAPLTVATQPADTTVATRPVRGSASRKLFTMAAMAAIGTVVLFVATGSLRKPAARPDSIALSMGSDGLDPNRIAVLYFDDHSETGTLHALANGLTEALITELSHVSALSVIPRNGVKPFSDRSVPLDSISQSLHAGTLVTGSVQKSGEDVRVSVQLIDAATGSMINSDTLRRAYSELFSLEDDLARRVAALLRQSLGREIILRNRVRSAHNTDAFLLVQQADEMVRDIYGSDRRLEPEQLRTAAWSLQRADSMLRLAQRLDPDWVDPKVLQGWVALGKLKLVNDDTSAARSLAEEGLRHAREAEEGGPTALTNELRGASLYWLGRISRRAVHSDSLFAQAETSLRRATELDPTLGTAWARLSRLLQYEKGRLEESNLMARRALEVDAYMRDAPDIVQRLYRTSMDMEKFSDAQSWCDRGRADYPFDARFVECALTLSAFTGTPRLTMDSVEKIEKRLRAMDPPSANAPIAYRYLYRDMLRASIAARAGERGRARSIAAEVAARAKGQPELELPLDYDYAHVMLLLGDRDSAEYYVHRYLVNHPEQRDYLSRDFAFRGIVSPKTTGSQR